MGNTEPEPQKDYETPTIVDHGDLVEITASVNALLLPHFLPHPAAISGP